LTGSEKAVIREIGNKIQTIGSQTESRARQVLESIKDDEEKQLTYDKRQIESRISGVEESSKTQKSKNDELIRQIEDFERNTNAKINDMRQQLYFLKDQLSREKDEERKIDQSIGDLSRHLGESEKELARSEMEEKLLKHKREDLEAETKAEVEEIRYLLMQEEKRQEETVSQLRRREKEVDERALKVKGDFTGLQNRHRELLSKVQSGLNNTLADTIGRYASDKF
jgi:chromosome segregation ATPase